MGREGRGVRYDGSQWWLRLVMNDGLQMWIVAKYGQMNKKSGCQLPLGSWFCLHPNHQQILVNNQLWFSKSQVESQVGQHFQQAECWPSSINTQHWVNTKHTNTQSWSTKTASTALIFTQLKHFFASSERQSWHSSRFNKLQQQLD